MLSLQWRAQLKAYLGSNGMVQVYGYNDPEQATESGSEMEVFRAGIWV